MICLLLHTQLLIDNTNLIPIALHVIMSNLVYMHSYKNTCIIVSNVLTLYVYLTLCVEIVVWTRMDSYLGENYIMKR